MKMNREQRIVKCLACKQEKGGMIEAGPMLEVLACDKNPRQKIIELKRRVDEANIMVESVKKMSDPRKKAAILKKAGKTYEEYYLEIREGLFHALCDVSHSEYEDVFPYRKECLFKEGEAYRAGAEEAMTFDSQMAFRLGIDAILAIMGSAETAYNGGDLTRFRPGEADYNTAIKKCKECIELCRKLAELTAKSKKENGLLRCILFHAGRAEERLTEIETEAKLKAEIELGHADLERTRQKYHSMRYPTPPGPNF